MRIIEKIINFFFKWKDIGIIIPGQGDIQKYYVRKFYTNGCIYWFSIISVNKIIVQSMIFALNKDKNALFANEVECSKEKLNDYSYLYYEVKKAKNNFSISFPLKSNENVDCELIMKKTYLHYNSKLSPMIINKKTQSKKSLIKEKEYEKKIEAKKKEKK